MDISALMSRDGQFSDAFFHRLLVWLGIIKVSLLIFIENLVPLVKILISNEYQAFSVYDYSLRENHVQY